MFESFEQADGSTAREYGDTGLGLTVTKDLVELHGGHLTIDSTEGLGSTFSFDLAISKDQSLQKSDTPVIRAIESEEEMEESAHSIEVTENGSKGGRTILIVDDEPVNIGVGHIFGHK
ncbi:ATP-binding protein [Deltaproteobacteria bacterium TL4]